MFNGFETFTVTSQDQPKVEVNGLKSTPSSPLPPLLLVHGYPQSYHIWHRVVPHLTSQYTVILMDLRGYGASSKPDELACYAKSAMARDCIAVMDHLGFDAFYVCAHDRGARVTHKLCVDHPARVKAAILLDICPTLAMFTKTDFDFAKAYFHWFFFIQKEPLPETLISAAPRRFGELFMGGRQPEQRGIFDEACFEYYMSVLEDPMAVHAMCQDYRASATLDLEEARADLEAGRLVECPLKVIWGKAGVIEKCFDAVEEWRAVSKDKSLVSGHSVESGHYIPEQAPDDVVKAIKEFFV